MIYNVEYNIYLDSNTVGRFDCQDSTSGLSQKLVKSTSYIIWDSTLSWWVHAGTSFISIASCDQDVGIKTTISGQKIIWRGNTVII